MLLGLLIRDHRSMRSKNSLRVKTESPILVVLDTKTQPTGKTRNIYIFDVKNAFF